ncbi:MAG TPA: DUF4328 domain-containing protein [Nannocystis sp.]|jgi:uncharacterized integral membrane protein
MSERNLFTAPTAALEREGPGGVRLPVLRYQLLIGVAGLGAVVSVAELALCVLLSLPVLEGLEDSGALVRMWRPGGLDLVTWLSWAAVGSLALLGVTAGLFLAWLVRARRNAAALGMSPRVPGALLWWFVPVANLLAPFVAVRGVYQASRGGGSRAPGWLVTWWLVWLATLLWVCIEVLFARNVEAVHFVFSDIVGVVLALGLAAQGALARPLLIAVVVAIQRAQQERRGVAR